MLLLLSALAFGACSASQAVDAPAPTATQQALTPTSILVPPTATAPAPTPLPATAALPLEATPTLFSEVLPEVVTPPPAAIRGGTALSLPAGTSTVWGGCASDGTCFSYNFYWAPTHEAVLQNGEAAIKVEHELCHAHQHLTVNGGAPLAPSEYDLHPWYETDEGVSFADAVAGLDWPWSNSAVNALEDFAWTCAFWYQNPTYLYNASPARYDWAAANLP